jgi:hypothetical protein
VLLDAARDIPGNIAWSSWDLIESEFMRPGATDFDYYQYLDNPFPIKDRYWFCRATVVGDPSGPGPVEFRWVPVDPAATYPDRYARIQDEHSGALQPSVNVGAWVFNTVGGQTEVRYRICTDAGGSIPDWAGEFAALRTLPTNVADLIGAGALRAGQ